MLIFGRCHIVCNGVRSHFHRGTFADNWLFLLYLTEAASILIPHEECNMEMKFPSHSNIKARASSSELFPCDACDKNTFYYSILFICQWWFISVCVRLRGCLRVPIVHYFGVARTDGYLYTYSIPL